MSTRILLDDFLIIALVLLHSHAIQQYDLRAGDFYVIRRDCIWVITYTRSALMRMYWSDFYNHPHLVRMIWYNNLHPLQNV